MLEDMVLFLIAFADSVALAGLCDLLEFIPWGWARAAHWTERARQLYRARSESLVNRT